MATIVNNSLTADESTLRVHSPLFYVPDPDKSGPLDGFQAYFGLTGRDPLVPDSQKLVYALQEDGTAVPIEQPVVGSAGGVPVYNGSTVGLAVNGSYSLKILDKHGAQKYYFPQVDAVNLNGFSGVIAEESQTVSGSLSLTYAAIETTTASFYKSTDATGTKFEGSFLRKDIDYTADTSSTITLINATADGTVILGRQMDPTGQIVPVTEGSTALFVFEDIASAVASNLQNGDTLTINGGAIAGDKLGGNKYLTVLGQPESPDGENVINLSNGNQIKAIENNFLLARYAEKTTLATSIAGTLNLDLNEGNVFKAELFENIGAINIVNANPDNTLTTSVTLKITQDATTARTVALGGFKWAGGTVPTFTTTLSGYDRFVFISDDGGATFDGMTAGQDFS